MFSVAAITTLICWFIQPQSKFQFVMLNQFGIQYVLMNGYDIVVLIINEVSYLLCYCLLHYVLWNIINRISNYGGALWKL